VSVSPPRPSPEASFPDDGLGDAALLAANTPAAMEELTTRYLLRAHRIARAVLGDDEAVHALDAACAHLGHRTVDRPPRDGGFGSRLMGAVAREAVAVRGAGEAAPGTLAGLSDRQCEVVVLAFYGRLTLRSIARELQLPVPTVAADMHEGVVRLAAAATPAEGA
jgi:GNAT superfamily N-acetyltransferase